MSDSQNLKKQSDEIDMISLHQIDSLIGNTKSVSAKTIPGISKMIDGGHVVIINWKNKPSTKVPITNIKSIWMK